MADRWVVRSRSGARWNTFANEHDARAVAEGMMGTCRRVLTHEEAKKKAAASALRSLRDHLRQKADATTNFGERIGLLVASDVAARMAEERWPERKAGR